MSAGRLAIACVIAAFAAACSFVPPVQDRLSGEFIEGKGVMIGRGTFDDGTEWTVHARIDRDLLCMFPALSVGEHRGASCSGVAQSGWAGGVELGFSCSGPTFVKGSFDASIRSVRIESSTGLVEVPVVPLLDMGIPSVALGFATPAGTRVVAVTTLDAGGNEIETVKIPSPPGGCR